MDDEFLDLPGPAPAAPAAPTNEVAKGEVALPLPLDDEPLDSRAEAQATVRRLRRELERLDADPKATARERANVAGALTSATRLLAKVDGSAELTVSQVLRSPHWRRVVTVLTDTLRAFPGANEAVGAALRRLETGS
jgi:hypothetical protein